MAVFDAWGQVHGVPLWSLFGGSTTLVETDMTVTAGDQAHAARSATAIIARGITTIKLKIGARPWKDDVDRLQAVHEAAPYARIFVDANGGYDASSAQSFLLEVAARNLPLALFEQPLPRDDPGWRSVAEGSEVPLCADESARSAADVVALAHDGCVRVINIKPMKCGIVEAVAMWHVARAHGMSLMIGGMVESILAMTASAHLAAGLGGFDFVDLDTPMFIESHPFIGGFRQDGGRLDLSHVHAGHGVALADRGTDEADAFADDL
jgi:L-alanine-DL-glutamate epimerase-like enolase superfamily enzyme